MSRESEKVKNACSKIPRNSKIPRVNLALVRGDLIDGGPFINHLIAVMPIAESICSKKNFMEIFEVPAFLYHEKLSSYHIQR